MSRDCTITRAGSGPVLIAPDELFHGFTVQGDRALVRADSGILKASTCPPGALHVRLVLVSVRHFLDRTGQRCLVGDAFADDRPVVEHEGERRRPRERCAAVRRLGRHRERLPDRELRCGPGSRDCDLARGLTGGRGRLRDLRGHRRHVLGCGVGGCAVGQRQGCDGEGGGCGPNLAFHRSFSLLVLVDSKYVIPRSARCRESCASV